MVKGALRTAYMRLRSNLRKRIEIPGPLLKMAGAGGLEHNSGPLPALHNTSLASATFPQRVLRALITLGSS